MTKGHALYLIVLDQSLSHSADKTIDFLGWQKRQGLVAQSWISANSGLIFNPVF
jgi:hypothetical protein